MARSQSQSQVALTTTTHDPRHPYTEADLGTTLLTPTHRVDLRPSPAPDVFYDAPVVSDWGILSWKKVGRPYRVKRYSAEKQAWEREHDEDMPIKTCWEMFNRSFQTLLDTDVLDTCRRAARSLGPSVLGLDLLSAWDAVEELVQTTTWNYIHRVEDAIWDPRGKRALFRDLDLHRPEILYLGAADGYEAMQLMAMYPGGHAVLVDYDDYCRTDRFGKFPEAYPFIGVDPASGSPRVWYRDQMDIDFEVLDIRDLKYGREFDIVLSVGLLEHFPDQYKPHALEMHRRFLKPGGLAIITTPRVQTQAKLFYTLFADIMNFAYRELMDVTQLGLYAHENGFEILRHGVIRAHNGIIARPR